jgi:hypothetical protein
MICPSCDKQIKFHELVKEHDEKTPKPFHFGLFKEVKYHYSCPHYGAKGILVEGSKKWLLFLVPVALLGVYSVYGFTNSVKNYTNICSNTNSIVGINGIIFHA